MGTSLSQAPPLMGEPLMNPLLMEEPLMRELVMQDALRRDLPRALA